MSVPPESAVATWLAELQRLMNQGPGSAIHKHLLQVATRGLKASGGAVWSAGDDRALQLESQIGLGDRRIDRVQKEWPGHAELLKSVLTTGRPQAVNAQLDTHRAGNGAERPVSQPLRVLAGPTYTADSHPNGVIELFLAGDSPSGSEQAALRALNEFCRKAATIVNAGVVGQPGAEELIRFMAVCRRIHSSLDVETVAVVIANEARTWIGCDRVSVFEQRGRKCRLLSISDLDVVDSRSHAVRSLQMMAESVVENGEPFWSQSTSEADGPVESRFAETPAWRAAALPVSTSDRGVAAGVIIAESLQETGGWDAKSKARIELVAAHAAVALENALAHRSLPLAWLGRRLQRMGWESPVRTLSRWALAAIVCLAVAAGLIFIPIDFYVSGRGELQPATQQDVFARIHGIVDAIEVSHGDLVAVDQPLIRLRSPEFERERTRLEGQLRTTQQQIDDLATLRTESSRAYDADRRSSTELAAREEELTAVLASTREQLAALARHESELTLTSPLSGRLLTWDVEQLLKGRPVAPGDRLLTVADVEGPWIIRIHVPDRDIRHITVAQEQFDSVPVSFVTATDVKKQHAGSVSDVARVVEHHPLDGPVVIVTVDVQRGDGLELRPGATVYPRIFCGRRPVGYVWFRRLIDSTRSWLAF